MTQDTIRHMRRRIARGDGLDVREITPEVIDYHIRYGNHLRAAVIASWARQLGAGLSRLWRPVPARPRQETMAEKFANGLAAIRCSAELLRDGGDLSPEERARFVSIVLEEEARLEAMLRELSGTRPAGAASRAT